MMKIPVTQSFMPPIQDYIKCVEAIWETRHLTNSGPYVLKLENQLSEFLGNQDVHFVSNGTVALQIAIKALGLAGDIITTPFSYVATTSAIVWEKCQPVFADIDQHTLNIDPLEIRKRITKNTKAILATHVFGNPCNVHEIDKIAQEFNLKVIYDAAHCFGVKYEGKHLTSYGDVSTLSFHATKIFHTIEGGAVISKSQEISHKVSYLRNFGHQGPEKFQGEGINGKNSEFHAAMGVTNLPYINEIISTRKKISDCYDDIFSNEPCQIQRPIFLESTDRNYSYYPILFESESVLLAVVKTLNERGIFPRRYFYPSLTSLNYITSEKMPIADSIATRVLCLPTYYDLPLKTVKEIANLVLTELN